MVTLVLTGLAAWFISALGVGILLGKLISAHERAVAPLEHSTPSTPRAA
jgi:uncharacterized membrane protein YphA (DoxX/SURF4 family)